LYLLPGVGLVSLFFIVPLFFIIIMSFTKWNGITAPSYVGINNYIALITQGTARRALLNTMLWILVGTFVHTPLGLLVALVLSRHFRGWSVIRNVIFLPNTFSIAALAIMWYFLLHPSLGLINGLLKAIGLEGRAWLADPKTALLASQLPFAIYIGFTVLIFLAHIESIPSEYYEAAKVDGASALQLDLFITIPLLRRAIALNILLNAAFCLKMVEYPLIMTGGGPGGLTYTLSLYMYYQMSRARAWGMTMATGVVMLIIGVAIEYLILRSFKYFEG